MRPLTLTARGLAMDLSGAIQTRDETPELADAPGPGRIAVQDRDRRPDKKQQSLCWAAKPLPVRGAPKAAGQGDRNWCGGIGARNPPAPRRTRRGGYSPSERIGV